MLNRAKQSPSDRVSDVDRQRAFTRIDELATSGVIRGEEERKLRERKVRLAVTRQQLDEALDGLPAQRTAVRASEFSRNEAKLRLDRHEALGHLKPKEAELRSKAVDGATTSEEIEKVFADLPSLTSKIETGEPLIGDAERLAAEMRLDQAFVDGRLERDEHAAAVKQVNSARTQSQIDAAFQGLKTPMAAAIRDGATGAGRAAAGQAGHVVSEGGRRARRAFTRIALSIGAGFAGLILLIAGIGLLAMASFLAAVVLFVAALVAVVGR